jgi:hypothetical protein
MEVELTKLHELLSARYGRIWDNVRKRQSPVGTGRLRWVHGQWEKICSSLGIERVLDKLPVDGYVIVCDPKPGGAWLRMSSEVALRILVLGI